MSPRYWGPDLPAVWPYLLVFGALAAVLLSACQRERPWRGPHGFCVTTTRCTLCHGQ